MGDSFHDMPKEAIRKMPVFSGGDSATTRNHLLMVTHIINRYCLPSQYNREDIKIRLFVCSLDGDVMKWLSNWPEDYIDSLQSIVNAFKDEYIKQGDLPCAPSATERNESNLVEN